MKQRCAQKAYEMIQDGMVIGLGGGSTVALLIHEIAKGSKKRSEERRVGKECRL